ncbi:MAG TPA: DUF5668 domain-containing protein [Caldisericia bacterium]|nr:DUF5668 domain-containing protein [Caldisericia bacterium]
MQKKRNTDRFNLFLGIIVIVAGVFFLLQNLFPQMPLWSYFWPLLPIVLGLTLIQMGSMFSDGGRPFFLITGSMLIMAGLLILLQSFLQNPYWWSYAWTLIFPGAFGVGQIICGKISSRKKINNSGISLLVLGIVFFVVGLVLFQFVYQNAYVTDSIRTQLNYGFVLVCLGIFILTPKKFYLESSRFTVNRFFTDRIQNEQEKSEESFSDESIMTEEYQNESSNEVDGSTRETESNNDTEKVEELLTQ